MLVPFGTQVVDTDGKAVGSLRHLVLDPQSREVVGFVVHHGILNRLDVVVPLSKVAAFGEEVRLALRADEIDDLQLFHAPHFQVMPDHWEMPLGFDQRHFFLVGGLGWAGGDLQVSRKISRITIKRGFLFRTEVAIPASMIGTINDRIALNIDAETVKSLAPSR